MVGGRGGGYAAGEKNERKGRGLGGRKEGSSGSKLTVIFIKPHDSTVLL